MSDQSKSLDILKDIGTAIVQSIDHEEFPTLKFPGPIPYLYHHLLPFALSFTPPLQNPPPDGQVQN